MVQILPRPESKGEMFAKMISGGLAGGAQGAEILRNAFRERGERKALSEEFGDIFGKIHSPDVRRQLLGGELERKSMAEKLNAQSIAEKEDYEKIKKAYGEEFADVWLASGQGERTALTNAALRQASRRLPIGGLFGEQEEQEAPRTVRKGTARLPSGETIDLPEIPEPENLTPSEKVKYKSSLRADNKKLHKENIDKSKGLKDTAQHLDILDNLNEKIPEGVSRLLIDKEGNIRPTALKLKLVPKEVERFSKTVNDFLTSAKDIFGSRVTNYDIAQFKSRLPSLLNSKEGRKEIIHQMKILNQIEQNYRNALKQIYSHYGLDGIPEEQAEALADQMTQAEEERLRSQLLTIGEEEPVDEMGGRPSLEEIFGG